MEASPGSGSWEYPDLLIPGAPVLRPPSKDLDRKEHVLGIPLGIRLDIRFRRAAGVLAAVTVIVAGLTVDHAGPASAQVTPDRVYRLVSVDNGARIVPDDWVTTANVPIVQYRPEIHRAETWRLHRRSDGYYVLENVAAQRCIQPRNGTATVDNYIDLLPCDYSAVQQWNIYEAHDGQYLISPRNNPNLAIAPAIAAGTDTWLQLKERVPSTDRLWLFVGE